MTRRPPELPPDRCALGLPLPLRFGKRRISIQAMTGAILDVRRPPALSQVITAAPPRWQRALRTLERLARNAGIDFRTHGSVAWQFLTGEAYVSSTSDIDLLWRPSSQADLEAGVAMLSAWEQRSGIRADGEVLLPDGSGMSWREWLRRPRVVLLKSLGEVTMAPGEDVLRMINTGMGCRPHSPHSASLRSAR